MALEDIILRTTTHAPYTNKGDELTHGEMDNNIIELADALAAANNPGDVTAYNGATTYSSGNYASYNSKLWRYINGTPSAGNAPEEGVYWTEASPGELVHEQNKDQYLDYGGANEVTAAQVKTAVTAGVKYVKRSLSLAECQALPTTPIELVAAPGAGKAVFPIEVWARLTFGTTAWTAGSVIAVKHETANVDAYSNDALLESTGHRNLFFQKQNVSTGGSTTDTQLRANEKLQVYVPGAPITIGDSTIEIFVIYSEITL